MSNPYIEYYQKQIGRGIPGFRGLRYQRGYILLSSLISKAIVPLLRSVKSIDPENLAKVAADILKAQGLTPGKPLADDIAQIGATATGALISNLQKGKGRKYISRKRRRKKSVKRKSCKRKVRGRKQIRSKKVACSRKKKECKKVKRKKLKSKRKKRKL